MTAMFKIEANFIETDISYHTVKADHLDKVFEMHDRHWILPSFTLPEIVEGDEIRLKQILINLVKNALKFTINGFVKIYMAYDHVNEELKTHVVDTGKGIKPEDHEKLFKMFGKLKRTAKMNSEGLGMGLMICQQLVTMNKGEIRITSEGEGRGTTAIFSFSAKNAKKTNLS